MIETITVEDIFEEFGKYTTEETKLLENFVTVLPSLFITCLSKAQMDYVDYIHLLAAEECINAGLARPIADIHRRLQEEIRMDYQMYDGC